MALAAVLVPVLVMVLTALILIVVCAWHWRNRCVFSTITQIREKNPSDRFSLTLFFLCPVRKKSSEGTYDLPHWDSTGM